VQSFFLYTFGTHGYRDSASTRDARWTYEYDTIGQLVHAVFDTSNPAIADQDIRYEYDPVGNRIAVTTNGERIRYVTNEFNQYESSGNTQYDYDAAAT
jgi:hypothetical protein